MSNYSERKNSGGTKIVFDLNGVDTISRNLYNLIIGAALVAGCLIALWMNTPAVVRVVAQIPALALLILYFVATLAATWIINRTDSAWVAALGFLLLASGMGLLLSGIVYAYTAESLSAAFLITVIILAVMTVAATIFPNVFLSIGPALGVSLLVTIVVELLATLIFKINFSVIDYAVVLIFCGYTGYDWAVAQRRDATVPNAMRSAASIYVDMVNIFLRVLRIMSKRRD